MKSGQKNRVTALWVGLAAWALCHAAHADSVLLGSDYLETLPGTFFDFGAPIGSVPLVGLPINPGLLGTTDTIVQRQADALLPGIGSTAVVPIELVQLSLVSAAPITVDFGGGPINWDVSVHLTPSTSSTGSMTIRHEGADNGTSAPEGTFDSFFDVFFTADFTEVGNPLNTFSIDDTARLETTNAPWSHELMLPGALLVTGPAGHPDANDHTDRPPLFGDDHVQQILHVKVLGGPGQHLVQPATGAPISVDALLPEPGTGTLMLLGLASIALLSRKSSWRRA